MRFLCLLVTAVFTQIAFAECRFTDRSVENSIRTYQQCIDSGHELNPDVKAVLGHASQDKPAYRLAIDTFSQEIESSDTPEAKVYLHRGIAWLALGKERQALRDFETFTSQEPNNLAGHFYRGVTLLEQRKYRDAVDAFETALSTNSGSTQNAQIHYNKAKAEVGSRDRQAAITTLGNAISSDPLFAAGYFERARLREKEDLKPATIEDYTRYLTLRPESAEAYYNRGLIYQDLRQDHLAIQDFNRALEINPRYVQPRASKGLTYLLPVLPVLLVLMAG